ncbi:MAG: L-lactate permease [Verrucomicrobia bacterium]|nr:MAG: L-lactate permease [Verrucomicrobiota bacterium]
MTWTQNYAPVLNLGVSALLAALPVVVLLGLLAFWHVRAHRAAMAGLAVALGLATIVYGMPVRMALTASAFGALFGLFPIGWIILNAIFIYDLSVQSGQFEVLQRQIAGISRDRRVQALLLAFSFGAFIEGAAGFGTPVAVSAALMIGLGFRPLEAAKPALIGNTAPVAYGALGTPLLTLSSLTDLDLHQLSAMVGRQLPVFSLVVPFWLVWAQVGWRRMLEVWPACLVTGLSFALTQFLTSNLHGPWLVDILASLVSMGALVAFMKVWQPKKTLEETADGAAAANHGPIEGDRAFRAWLPWLLLSVAVFVWGLPWVKGLLNGLFAPRIPIPGLHEAVLRVPPVTPEPEPEKALFTFNFLSATGTALLLAGLATGLCLGLKPVEILRSYGRTLKRVRTSLLTIALMLALGFTTRYSGSDTTLGLAMASTGVLFPFFSPLIGWLGVALTGSDTSSNVLFGNLQKVSAQQLGLSPVLMAASNSSGGVMGKMIDAQSIVVASVATGGRPDSPDVGTVLRAVFWHSVALALLMGVLVTIQAYLLPFIVPGS